MLLSGWWKWWAGSLLVLACASRVSAELEWPRVPLIVDTHLSHSPVAESLQNAAENFPYSYYFVQPAHGRSIEPSENQLNLNDFSARSGLALETANPVEESQDEEIDLSSRSPRFISKIKEWYKEKEKEKKDEDNVQVIISHHAAQSHSSDHHSSHGYGHGGHGGYHGHGHGNGHGHGHYGHGNYDYGHGHGHGHGHGYGHGGSHSDIHIHGNPYQSHYRPPHYYPHYPYPHHPPPQHQPVVQPIIIGGGSKKGKRRGDGKIIILSGGSSHGNYGGYSYIQG